MCHFELLSSLQESTPVELPSVGVLNKVNPIVGGFKLPAPAKSGQEPGSHGSRPVKPVPGTSVFSHTSNAVSSPGDDADEELDLLLGLHKPVAVLSLAESETSNTVEDVSAVSEKGEWSRRCSRVFFIPQCGRILESYWLDVCACSRAVVLNIGTPEWLSYNGSVNT